MFYKPYLGKMLAQSEVVLEAVTLTLATQKVHTYPVEGWYYFESDDAALAFFQKQELPKEVSDTEITLPKIITAIQKVLDDAARSKGYGGVDDAGRYTPPGIAISTYDGDDNPRFAQEAADYKKWRSLVWTTAYTYLENMNKGLVPPIKTLEQAKALIPPLVWTPVV